MSKRKSFQILIIRTVRGGSEHLLILREPQVRMTIGGEREVGLRRRSPVARAEPRQSIKDSHLFAFDSHL